MASAGSPSPPHPPRVRVLIIDDDRALANGMRRLLRIDFDAIAVDGMREALDLLVTGERFDVIVCDVMMPSGSGMDFYEALAKQSAEDLGRIIFVTGGILATREREFIESIGNAVLSKPVDFAMLRSHVRAIATANRLDR